MRHPVKKRKRYWLFGLLIFSSIVIILKDQLLCRAAEVYIRYVLPKSKTMTFSFGSLEQEKNQLVIRDVRCITSAAEFEADSVRFSCHFSILPFFAKSHLQIHKLSIDVASEQSDCMLQVPAIFFSDSKVQWAVEIEDGRIFSEWLPKSNVGFSLHRKNEDENTSVLSIYLDEMQKAAPFFTAEWQCKQGMVFSNIKAQECPIAYLLPLFALQKHSWSAGWEKITGKVSTSAEIAFHPVFGVKSIQGDLELIEAELLNPQQGFELKTRSLRSTLSYPMQETQDGKLPFWKNMDIFMTLEEGALSFSLEGNSIGIEEALGEFRLHPEEDPFLKIHGNVCFKDVSMPFSVEGKGEILEEGKFWIQGESKFLARGQEQIVLLSLCHHEKDQYILQAEGKYLSREFSDLLQTLNPILDLPACRITKGEVDASVMGSFKGKHLQRLEFSDCRGKDLSLSLPGVKEISSPLISLQGIFISTVSGWDIEMLHCEAHSADIVLDACPEPLKNVAGKIDIHRNQLQPSYVELTYKEMKGNLQVMGAESPHLFHMEVMAPLEAVRSFFPGLQRAGGAQNANVSLVADIHPQEKTLLLECLARLMSKELEEDIEFRAEVEKKISRDIADFFSPWNLKSFTGSFQASKISDRFWAPFLQCIIPDVEWQGSIQAEGSFDLKKVQLSVPSYDLQLTHPFFVLQSKAELGQEKMEATYDWSSGKWLGKLPVSAATIKEKTKGFDIHVLETAFFFEGDQVWADEWKMTVNDFPLAGSLYIDEKEVQIVSKAVQGRFETVLPLLEPFIHFHHPLAVVGDFSVPERGCILHFPRQDNSSVQWKMEGSFKNVSYPLEKLGRFEGLQGEWQCHSSGELSIKNVKGDYCAGHARSQLCFYDFSWQPNKMAAPFCFMLHEVGKEWLRCSGEISKKEKFYLNFDSLTHFFGISLEIKPIEVNDRYEVSPVQARAVIKAELIPSYWHMWEKMGIMEHAEWIDKLESLTGNIQTEIQYDLSKEKLEATAKSQDLAFEGKRLGPVFCKIENIGNEWKLGPCQVGDSSLRMVLRTENGRWSIPSLQFQSPFTNIEAAGEYLLKTREILLPLIKSEHNLSQTPGSSWKGLVQLQGAFKGAFREDYRSIFGKGHLRAAPMLSAPLHFAASHVKEIPFSFDSKEKLTFENLAFDLYGERKDQKIGSVSIKHVAYLFAEKRWQVQSASLLMSDLAQKSLRCIQEIPESLLSFLNGKECQLQLDADLSSTYKKVSGSFKDGVYTIRNIPLECKHLQFLWEQDRLYASFKTQWQKQPIWIQAQADLQTPSLHVLIKEHPEKNGMALSFRSQSGSFLCERLQGSLKGISLDLHRSSGQDSKLQYFGSMKVDFSNAASLLPHEWAEKIRKWRLGKGYECKGHFVLGQTIDSLAFSGEIFGEMFDCMGKQFQHFYAKADLSSSGGLIQNMKMEDVLGHCSIKTMKLIRNKNKTWSISAPLVYVKDFTPSLLLPDTGSPRDNGVMIKNLSFYDLKGELGDLRSFEGNGSLNFSNLSKKEFSFWDIPLSMIKDLGLDPGILTPITGEVDFQLWQGKCHITDLRNAYSEGKRSQFFIAETGEDAFLDVEGNWHIDLRMKQNVVWKITEDLILSVRGNLQKPKYSFKRNETVY
jgi:hypothetical protein